MHYACQRGQKVSLPPTQLCFPPYLVLALGTSPFHRRLAGSLEGWRTAFPGAAGGQGAGCVAQSTFLPAVLSWQRSQESALSGALSDLGGCLYSSLAQRGLRSPSRVNGECLSAAPIDRVPGPTASGRWGTGQGRGVRRACSRGCAILREHAHGCPRFSHSLKASVSSSGEGEGKQRRPVPPPSPCTAGHGRCPPSAGQRVPGVPADQEGEGGRRGRCL